MTAIIFKGTALNGQQILSQECISFNNKVYLSDKRGYCEIDKRSLSAKVIGKD